ANKEIFGDAPEQGLSPFSLLLYSISLSPHLFSLQTQANTPSVTWLHSHTFGTWTFLSALVRGYCAYYPSNPQLYDLCLWTYWLAFAHFGSEWLYFGTAKFGRALIGPLVVSTTSVIWMTMQRSYYLGL